MGLDCFRADVECVFFFLDFTATAEIYTLSLHDALPICHNHVGDLLWSWRSLSLVPERDVRLWEEGKDLAGDRKSTRLNSSHRCISYAVFCLKKKSSFVKIPNSVAKISSFGLNP